MAAELRPPKPDAGSDEPRIIRWHTREIAEYLKLLTKAVNDLSGFRPVQLYGATVGATTGRLTTDGAAATGSNVPTLPDVTGYRARGWRLIASAEWTGGTSGAQGDCASWDLSALLARPGAISSTTLVGGGGTSLVPTSSRGDGANWRLSVTADTTLGALNVSGVGATNNNVSWRCLLLSPDPVFSVASGSGGTGGGASAAPTSGAIGFTNLDAETGNTSGWTIVSGNFAARTVAAGFPAAAAGTWYFWGGAGPSTALARQEITIAPTLLPAIDLGTQYAKIVVSERSAITAIADGDAGRVFLEFLDGGGIVLGSVGAAAHQPPSASWATVTYDGLVPPGTRVVRLVYSCVTSQPNADYYVDSIVATWETSAAAAGDLLYRSLGAEAGSDGWVTTTGRVSGIAYVAARTGSNHFSGGAEATSIMYQDRPVVAARQAAVDGGAQNITLTFYEQAFDALGDEGRVYLEFLNSGGTSLGTLGSARTRPAAGSWTTRTFTGAVPSGTRTIRLWYEANRTNGTSNDYYVDDISVTWA